MRPRLTLASSVAGAVIVALDGTVLTVAQPTLQRDLGAGFAQAQWTSTGYLVAVAGLLVFGGRLGDRYGHRLLFGLGMLGFGAASAAIGLAPGIGSVIALRVLQGVCGALLQPATLGMLRAMYPPERLRTALAVRTAAIGLGAAVGPVLGGALVTWLGWRAVFFLNVLPALTFGALALAGWRADGRPSPDGGLSGMRQGTRPAAVPYSDDRAHPHPPARLDLPGALLLAVALGCLVHALVGLPDSGWTAASGVALGVAGAAGLAFVRQERRAADPLVPADLVGSRPIAAALAVLVAASAALHGALFACVYLLQQTLDPFESAVRSLPLAVLMVAAAVLCPLLLRRVGARRATAGAMAVLAAGILLLARSSGTLPLCTGFALVGAGFGTVMVAATQVVVRQAPVASAGVAGGLQQTALNVGPVLGVAAAAALAGAGGLRFPLPVLAALAAAGATAALLLPGSGGTRPATKADRAVDARPARSLRDHEV
ncbi:MFS transporter [Streptomyces sp. enrichment culture]|uniref:MFS transporter n=1 Tax=Streptomyces sp. enrichment culture TaxID=1795815 RepID=UPI003F569EB2